MRTQLPSPKGAQPQCPQFSAHVCCGQAAGWIKMPLGMEVGLGPGPGPGDIVLDGDPAPQKWGHSTPNFGPCLLWPNGWMDPGETRHEGLPRPTPHSVRWGPSSSKRGTASPIFSPCLLWPNGWMDQDVSWYGCRPWPRPQCVRLGPSPPLSQRGTAVPVFSAHV